MSVLKKFVEKTYVQENIKEITCDVCGATLSKFAGVGKPNWRGGTFEFDDIHGGNIADPNQLIHHWDLCDIHAYHVLELLIIMTRNNGKVPPEPTHAF